MGQDDASGSSGDTLLRISAIKVRGLFGLYNHSVRLNLEDRITIIHGPNGVGKTQLLRLIDAFVHGRFFQMFRTPFDSFEIDLDNGVTIGVRSKALEASRHDSKLLQKFEFFRSSLNQEEMTKEITPKAIDPRRLARVLDHELSWIAQFGDDNWLDRRSQALYTSEQLVMEFAEHLPERHKKDVFSEPEWLSEVRARVRVHLIETQRLLSFSTIRHRYWSDFDPAEAQDRIVSTVKDYASQLQKKISETLTEYAKVSQSLDQSFPQRLLRGDISVLDVTDLKTRMDLLEERRSELKRIGLVDDDYANPFDTSALERLDSTQKAVMSLYAYDTGRKLAVLEELARRVLVMLDNVNKKFRYKAMSIDKKSGLTAQDKNGRTLDLDSLSSGEQHELVLIYDLLFRVSPDTLVMIDEPELSLHINWQRTFFSDLESIVRTANFDVLLATHSPFIAGDRTDLMLNLAGESS